MTNSSNKTNWTHLGGYKNLLVYNLALIIFDLNIQFCKKYLSNYSEKRNVEQMIQAARSGKQNNVEGSLEKSVETNIKLTGVARASFGELLEDYKDYIRSNNLLIWDKNDTRVKQIRYIKIPINTNYPMSNK